jgi:hypothetical protein
MADPAPPQQTDWKLVAVTAGVTAGLVAAFFLALKHAGKR